jgi:hypothetical protein
MEIKTKHKHARLAIGIDESMEDEKFSPMLLVVPDVREADHEHIELTWEGARALHQYLGRVIDMEAKISGFTWEDALNFNKEEDRQ